MGQTAFAVLDRWLIVRKQRGIGHASPVFCTLNGGAIHQAQIRKWFANLAAKAGIEKRVHAQGLRHTFAFEMANEGHPIHLIQKALGHANAAITSLYINHLAPNDVIDTMKSREWKVSA